ncbi:DUF4306 domain-containing protein [Cerasibacillus sp. JNUCC 74]
MKKIAIFILLIGITIYTFFLSYWTGSYLMLEPNWKDIVVFTPETVTDRRDIYLLDKLIFAFKAQPLASITFLLSGIAVIGFCIYFYRRFREKQNQKKEI